MTVYDLLSKSDQVTPETTITIVDREGKLVYTGTQYNMIYDYPYTAMNVERFVLSKDNVRIVLERRYV